MSLYPEMFGLESQADAIRWSFITVSVWWTIFLLPLSITYKERVVNTSEKVIKELNNQAGDVAGIKTVTLQIDGRYAFGWLKGENGIAQVLEGRRIFAELSVVENLRLGGHTNSKDIPQNIDRVLDLFPILKERSKGEAGSF